MDFSLSVAGAASTALSMSTAQEALAIAALKAAEKERTSILELFSGRFGAGFRQRPRPLLNILV
jgi:hypothetical protein